MSDDSVGPGKQGPQIDQGAPSNLLTEAQKRQNVESEKRRRAGIKIAFEELQMLVPALRSGAEGGAASYAGSTKRSRDDAEEAALVENAANIKSEAYILEQTVAHIRELTDERAALMQKIAALKGRK